MPQSVGVCPFAYKTYSFVVKCSHHGGSPSPGIEKTKTTKAELRVALHDAFAYCNRAYDALTDASANETVKAYGQERNKLGVLWFNASHNLEHYGNLVVYMRLKGIVPPSSESKP